MLLWADNVTAALEEKWLYSGSACCGVSEAWDQIQQSTPDLISLDLELPLDIDEFDRKVWPHLVASELSRQCGSCAPKDTLTCLVASIDISCRPSK